jgi:hypothetical protein
MPKNSLIILGNDEQPNIVSEIISVEWCTAIVNALERFVIFSSGATYNQSSIPENTAASFEPLNAPAVNFKVALLAGPGGIHPGESLHLPYPLSTHTISYRP